MPAPLRERRLRRPVPRHLVGRLPTLVLRALARRTSRRSGGRSGPTLPLSAHYLSTTTRRKGQDVRANTPQRRTAAYIIWTSSRATLRSARRCSWRRERAGNSKTAEQRDYEEPANQSGQRTGPHESSAGLVEQCPQALAHRTEMPRGRHPQHCIVRGWAVPAEPVTVVKFAEQHNQCRNTRRRSLCLVGRVGS